MVCLSLCPGLRYRGRHQSSQCRWVFALTAVALPVSSSSTQGGSPSRLFRWSVYRFYLLVYRGQGRIGFCQRVGATPGVDLVPKTVAVPMGFGFDRDNRSAAGLTVSYVDEASDSVGNHLGVTYTQTDKNAGGVGLIPTDYFAQA